MGTNKKRWSELSPATRRAITIGATVDMTLRAVAIADLVKRPQSQVKGSKTLWAIALAGDRQCGPGPRGLPGLGPAGLTG